MSADNVIYIKQEGNQWVVWHDSASNDDPQPRIDSQRFDTESEALKAAHDLQDKVGWVEYGVQHYSVD